MESGGAIQRFSSVFRSIARVVPQWLILVASVGACRKSSPSRYDPPNEVKADPSASAPLPPKEEIDPSTLGFASRPNEPSKDANDAMHDALAKHKAKKWADSRALFEKAIAASPDYALAHFDLACAASRLGDMETAKNELESLLLLDFAAFDPRLEADDDLATFRASPQGDDLRDRAEKIRAAWLRAANDGVSAVMFRARAGAVDYPAAKEAQWLRAGVYVPSTHKFLTLVPDVTATDAWYDRDAHKAVLVEARIDRCQLDFCPNLKTADVYIFDALSANPASHATYDDGNFMEGVFVSVLDGGTARARFTDCSVSFAGPCDTGWMRIDGKDFRYDASTLPTPRMQMISNAWGAELTVMPPDWSLDEKSATLKHASGKTIALDKLHKDGTSMMILDGDRALVETSHNDCDCEHFPEGDHPVHDHVVSIVDVAGKSARVWNKGPGVAAIAIDPRGGLYLQVDDEVERWSASSKIESDAPEMLPAGVMLTAPIGAPGYCCAL
jgi:hypothetical protein